MGCVISMLINLVWCVGCARIIAIIAITKFCRMIDVR